MNEATERQPVRGVGRGERITAPPLTVVDDGTADGGGHGGGPSTSGGEPTPQRRAVIYVRVSTKEQAERDGDPEGYSIPAQREACMRRAAALDAVVVGEYVDRGESAPVSGPPPAAEDAGRSGGRTSGLRDRAQGGPLGTKPDRRRNHQLPSSRRRGCARVGHREHRRNTLGNAAARHHELDRGVLHPQPGARGHQGQQQKVARRHPRTRRPATSTCATWSTVERTHRRTGPGARATDPVGVRGLRQRDWTLIRTLPNWRPGA